MSLTENKLRPANLMRCPGKISNYLPKLCRNKSDNLSLIYIDLVFLQYVQCQVLRLLCVLCRYFQGSEFSEFLPFIGPDRGQGSRLCQLAIEKCMCFYSLQIENIYVPILRTINLHEERTNCTCTCRLLFLLNVCCSFFFSASQCPFLAGSTMSLLFCIISIAYASYFEWKSSLQDARTTFILFHYLFSTKPFDFLTFQTISNSFRLFLHNKLSKKRQRKVLCE